MRFFILTLIFITTTFAQAIADDNKVFNAETFTLDNGLQVVVIPNTRAPVVTHMVWYKVGSADEKPGETGLAHFLEHLLFKGSKNVAPGAFSKFVKSYGGQDNAFTNYDFTAYFQSIAVEHLPKVMEMEADRMKSILLPPDEVDSERLVVLEERRQRTDNNPEAFFMEQMRAALFVNHPYADPVIGWIHELDSLKRQAALDFYNKWYAPNNAILIVTGDITAAELKPLAKKYYGPIKAKPIPERNWTRVPNLLANQTVTLHHPVVRQAVFRRMYRVPSYNQADQASLALQVLENALSGGSSTRLYQSLVVDQQKAVDIQLQYDGAAWSDGRLTISAFPAQGVSLPELENAIEDELRKLVTEPLRDNEIDAAKTRLKAEAIYARDSLEGPAMIVGYNMATGSTLDDIEYWPQHIDSVTAEQIQTVVKEFLDPDDNHHRAHVTGYLYPAEDKK